ncbi:helix-turn-helix domain-containing protein [Actinacidiphila acidipaludis]|uniref:helix-turn-helix domain-containing protein n=1 Tax=Actinacidiphila acidipaludis TaxID=2873382 RepID=UPI0027DEFBDF|nr:pyridoxamine 5'-phosphate oxidase family protein [Streptomyces acidipaludis]
MPHDLASRVAERLTQLDMTERELSRKAGMSTKYLEHLLVCEPDFDPGGLLRIAAALGLTRHELLEGRDDLPPGQSEAAERPVLARLTEPECWDKLGTHGVGRIALPSEPGPAVFPVNYVVDTKTILYRTAEQGAAAPRSGASVSFETDRIDDDLSQGWSVLVTGTAERIDDAAAAERLAAKHDLEPWAGGERALWVRVRPTQVTGRHITTM